MKTIKSVRVFLGIGALLLAVGCGSNVVKKVQKLADEACACKDRACAEKVNAKFTAFQKEHMKDKVGKGDAEKLMKSTLRLGQCLAKQLGRVPGIQSDGSGGAAASGGPASGKAQAGGAAAGSGQAGGAAAGSGKAKAGAAAGSGKAGGSGGGAAGK